MENNIIEEVRKFVEEECKKPSSLYGYDPYVFHFKPVVEIARKLAERLNADLEIVEIAAWLHDIGSILKGRIDHHITGAQIAEEKLKKLGYPSERIEKVKYCILSHRGSKGIIQETLEAKIIAQADAIDSFNRLSGLFEAAYVYEKLSREEARVSVKNKLENKWNQITLIEARELIKPKYDAAMLLLK